MGFQNDINSVIGSATSTKVQKNLLEYSKSGADTSEANLLTSLSNKPVLSGNSAIREAAQNRVNQILQGVVNSRHAHPPYDSRRITFSKRFGEQVRLNTMPGGDK